VSSLYSAFFSFSAIAYLVLGAWVVARQKDKVQQLYGLLCLTTCLWQAIWAILFTDTTGKWVYIALQTCYTGIVFVPAIFLHFISEFTEQKNRKIWLRATYGMSVFLVFCVWIDRLFIDGFVHYSWGRAAKAGVLHPIFVVLVTIVIVRTLVLLQRMEIDPATQALKKRQTILFKFGTYIYLGGAIDILSNFGIPMFPFSFLFTGVSVLLFGYAIFRYQFLAMAAAPETEEDLGRREAASQEMQRLGMAAAFPLVSQGELLGYLLLGEKMSEESYSKEDLLLLRIVANQAALASQRVRYLEMAVHGARTEMLGEIAGGFAHEIKTPLANISLPAELSIMDITDLEEGRKKLEDVLPELKLRMKDIMQQTFKASEKIEAIRQFSKPGQQVQLEAVDIGIVLQNSLGLLEHLLRKMGIRLKTEFPATIAPIRGSAKQLEIVFVNLIKNAVEAMGNNPSAALARNLSLTGKEENNWIVVSVKDSGPGMKRTDIGHLFEAYFTTKGSAGTGMGLFLSHQVIKAHGGAIEVKSEEGQGTEFIIRLPKFISEASSGAHKAA
jgi:signal transduction histidine kinase